MATAVDASAPDAATTGFAAQPIAPDTPPPPGARPKARVVGGVRFTDRRGPAEVWLLEVAGPSRSSVTLEVRYLAGPDRTLVRAVKDRGDCARDNLTAFAPARVELSDRDRDGDAEIGFGYLVGCGDGAATAKQLLLRGADKLIVRGPVPGAGEPEPGADRWFPADLQATLAAFDANAAALDVADVTAGDGTIYDATSHVDEVEIDEKRGKVEVRLSYPELPMLGRGEAAVVTAAMRDALAVNERYTSNLLGTQDGACKLGLVTDRVIGVRCEIMMSIWTQEDFDQGIGGAPAGPAVLGMHWWRGPGRPEVKRDEFVRGVPASCAWLLTPEGLVWLEDANEDAACPRGTLAWSALAPSTDRAKALTAAMIALDADP